MIFKNLKLKNFKSHINTSIDFNNGISLIVGSNGAGKSSIFEAITFALFKQSTVKNTDLVRTTKEKEGKIEMEVKLTFSTQSGEYRVERKIIKNKAKDTTKSSAKLFEITPERDVTIVSGIKEVDKAIEQILSMDANTYMNAIHIRQGEISDLIDKTPADRKKLIGQLLKLEDLENAYRKLPQIMFNKQSRKDNLEGRIRNEDDLNDELSQLNENHNILTEKGTIMNKTLEDIKGHEEDTSKEKQMFDDLKIEFNNLNIAMTHAQEDLTRLNQTKEDLENNYNRILENENEMEVLKPLVESLEIAKQFKDSFISLNSLKKEESLKQDILSKINANKQIIESERENHDRYVQLRDEITQDELALTELKSEIKQARKLQVESKKTFMELEKYKGILDGFSMQCSDYLKGFDIEIAPIEDKSGLDGLESIVTELIGDSETRIAEAEVQLKDLNDERVRLTQESQSLMEPLADIKKVENKCPTCQSEISKEKKDELIGQYEGTIDTNSKRIAEIEETSKALEEDKSKSDAVLKRLNSIKADISKNEIIISQIENLQGEMAERDEEISQGRQKETQYNELNVAFAEKTKQFKALEANYNEYVKADTLLKSQDEGKITQELEELSSQSGQIEENLKGLIGRDSSLSMDITQEELNAKIADLTAKSQKYHELMGSVKDKQSQEEKITQNQGEIEGKTGEIEEIKAKLEASQYDAERHEELSKSVVKLQNDFNSLFASIEVNKNEIKNNEEKIQQLENQIEENKKYIVEYDALCDYLDLLEKFRYFYSKDGVQKDLRSQSRPLIQAYTRDFFEKFNFNYSDLILSDEYDISIFGPEGEVKLDMVSGGEKIAIALSLRLAITQAMSKGSIETILLDEPTIHLDSYRKHELITVLRSMSVIPQMIIVTHDSELEAAADSIIKVKKVDGISKIEEE